MTGDKTVRVHRTEWEFLHSENEAGENLADTFERLREELEDRRGKACEAGAEAR